MEKGRGRVLGAGLWLSAAALLSCREPTQITVEVTTDVPCEAVVKNGVSLSAGGVGEVEGKPANDVKRVCEGGKVGTVVVVPSGEKDAQVEIRVVGGVTKSAESCSAENKYAGCVVARRVVRFVEHEGLKLRVELRQECADKPCEGDRRTCVEGGECASAVVTNAEGCTGTGCGEESLEGSKGGTGGQGGAAGQSGSGGAGKPGCGDGKCEGGETKCSCPSDCGSPGCGECGLGAGDGVCNCNETKCSAPNECGTPVCGECGIGCGDGICNCGETAASCGQDCGKEARPSCSGLGKICGGEDCCMVDAVESGTFPMGRSVNSADSYDISSCGASCDSEQPEHEVKVDSYGLDRYEVTVGRFRRFVAGYEAFKGTLVEGKGEHPKIPGSGWKVAWTSALPATASGLTGKLKQCDPTFQTWTDSAGANENKPINCVGWYEAFAFCVWDGGRLPTEAEWEYAAAGGTDNRLYPWGPGAPTCELANFSGCLGVVDEVGKRPSGKGKWGQQDLAGNVWEWNLDWHGLSWYTEHSGPGSCDNCADIGSGSSRVKRGGSFSHDADDLRAAYRHDYPPALSRSDLGVRCARTP